MLSFVHVIMALLFVFLSDYPMSRITTADILYVFHVFGHVLQEQLLIRFTFAMKKSPHCMSKNTKNL